MKRRLANLVTALSLLLCVALVAMWVYSFWSYDAVGFWPWPPQRRVYGFVSNRGSLAFITVPEGDGSRWWGWRHSTGGSNRDRLRAYAGFVFRVDQTGLIVGVPHPVVCLLLAAPLGSRLLRSARRRAPGLCRTCGYDLRATPGRCPECGTEAPADRSAGGRPGRPPGPAAAHPERCTTCGSAEFVQLESELAHAVPADGGPREYWLVVTVRCAGCGRTCVGDYGPTGGDTANIVAWRDPS